MSQVLETVAGILFFSFILALFFLFGGTPDLWDKLRERAMQATEPVKCEVHK
jgi:hypothetical protein